MSNGIELLRGHTFDALTGRGHCDLSDALDSHVRAKYSMARIFEDLDGDFMALSAKKPRRLKPDFVLASGHIVELDEGQHFTSARLLTLDHYPNDPAVLFDVDEYRSLCLKHKSSSDKYFAHKTAVEFPGSSGRQRQRAFLDAVRDLVAPSACGIDGVLRVAVPERDLTLGLDRLKRQLQRHGIQ